TSNVLEAVRLRECAGATRRPRGRGSASARRWAKLLSRERPRRRTTQPYRWTGRYAGGLGALSAAPQLQVKCAGTPMAHAGSRDARYHGSELRLLEPARDGAAQHPPLGAQFTAEGLPALAGDDEHAPFTPGVCADKKAQQSRVGLPLVKTVQVEQRIDLHLARGDLTSFAAIE